MSQPRDADLDAVQAAFREPAPIYSPVPIWWWSGEPLTRERLTWQMERLAEGGVRNAIVLNLAPRGPLFGCVADDPPFFSEEWWALFRHVLEEGKRLGLCIWFYDQLGFSGARLQEELIMAHPSCAGASLERLEADARPGASVDLAAPPGATVLSAAAGRLVAADRLEDLQDLSGMVEDGGHLRWTAPVASAHPEAGAPGRPAAGEAVWRVLLFFTRREGFDYLNPEAAARLIDRVHGEFVRRCGDYVSTSLVGSFQDEFPALPRWTADFAACFQERRGYDLLPWLPALFYDCGPRTPAVRVAYSEVIAALAEEAFFRPLFDWHERHGLLCGYDQIARARAADPVDGQAYYLDYFRTMRHYSAPGCDMDGAARPHTSIAHLYGRPRVWLEGFHSSGWGQTIEDIVSLLHPWYREGVTLYNPHAVYYSTRGSWWEWAPPDTSWRQPYWRHYPLFAAYVARLSYLLSQGEHVCDIALLYPATTMQAELAGGRPTARGEAVRELWWAINRLLDDERRDADILDDDSLARATVEDGRLCVSGERYRMLILPGTTTLRRDSLARIRAFAESGGLVVFCGAELPLASAEEGADDLQVQEAVRILFGHPSGADRATDGLASWLREPEALASFLDAHVPRAVSGGVPPEAIVAGEGRYLPQALPHHGSRDAHLLRRTTCVPHLPSLQRRMAGCDLFLVLSDVDTRADGIARYHAAERDHAHAVSDSLRFRRVTFHARGRPEVWDALTGDVRPVRSAVPTGEYTEVTLDFGQAPACLVLFRPFDDQATQSAPQAGSAGASATLHGLPVAGATIRALEGPWRSELWPTLDNRWGDFALPASAEPPPVECRTFRYRLEGPNEDGMALGWHTAGLDDSAWETVTYSFGPYWWVRGPLPPVARDELSGTDRSALGERGPATGWQPCVYSQRLGIAKDPIYATQLGPRGHIPEEFSDLGAHPAGSVFEVATTVSSATDQDLVALIGSTAATRLWVNGVEIDSLPETTPYLWRGAIHLAAGPNDVRLRLESAGILGRCAGTLRLWVRFAPPSEELRQASWIWTPAEMEAHITPGRRYFRYTVDLEDRPIRAVIRASGDNGYRLFANGELVDTQGECDAYIMGHVTTYDLAPYLVPGRNVLAVEALPPRQVEATAGARSGDLGAAFIVDGEAELPGGRRVELSTGRAWRCAPAMADVAWTSPTFDDTSWPAANELAAPPMWFPGEPSVLLFRPRPHPLADVSWLHGPQAAGPNLGLVYDAYPATPKRVGWYRFTLPPGTTGLHLRMRGAWQLYVDGEPIAQGTASEGSVAVAVPSPDSPDPALRRFPPPRPCAIRVEHERGAYAGAALPDPVTVTMGPGTVGLGAWAEQGLAHYAGGLVYETEVELTPREIEQPLELDLGRVRGSAEVWLNGEPLGVRLWHPYRFPLNGHARAGRNSVRVLLLNTLGPHYGAANPSPLLYPGQEVSGLFGPVRLVVAV